MSDFSALYAAHFITVCRTAWHKLQLICASLVSPHADVEYKTQRINNVLSEYLHSQSLRVHCSNLQGLYASSELMYRIAFRKGRVLVHAGYGVGGWLRPK